MPQQERPRICLIDVNEEIAEALISRGYNCYKGTLGPLVEVPNTSLGSSHECLLNFDFPPNLHEYDIVVVDLQNPTKCQYNKDDHQYTHTKSQRQLSIISSFPQSVFDPRPLSASFLEPKFRSLMEKDSILIVFTAPQEEIQYQPISITAKGAQKLNEESHSLYDFYSYLPEWENIKGKDTDVVSKESAYITSLLLKHNHDATYAISFNHPANWKDNKWVKKKDFLPLMEASTDKIVAFVRVKEKNFAFFFPNIKNKKDFITELFEIVLPAILPTVFPYSTQFAWLNDSLYRLPNEKELISEKMLIQAKYQEKLENIEVKINSNKQEYGYLHDLLTQSGAALVKTVEKFFIWLEFENVINVDETNPDLQEEDLCIETDNGLLVIEVKGIGGTSTDSECSQISKIKYRRSKKRKRFDVFALYCVNHQRFLPPENRQNPPFNATQIQDAENDERGLVTTYDLFKLYFSICEGFVSKQDARSAMLHTGLVEFHPSNAIEIPGPFEKHHNGFVLVFQAEDIEFRKGMNVLLENKGCCSSATIQEIQVNGESVENVSTGEIGIKLSKSVSDNTKLWLCQK